MGGMYGSSRKLQNEFRESQRLDEWRVRAGGTTNRSAEIHNLFAVDPGGTFTRRQLCAQLNKASPNRSVRVPAYRKPCCCQGHSKSRMVHQEASDIATNHAAPIAALNAPVRAN